MKCKHCGYALSNNSPLCPHCGMLMSEEQLKRRKQINGYNNPYMERLNELNKKKIDDNIEEQKKVNTIKADLIILGIVIIIIILAIIIYMKNR